MKKLILLSSFCLVFSFLPGPLFSQEQEALQDGTDVPLSDYATPTPRLRSAGKASTDRQDERSIVQNIADINMRIFPHGWDSWESDDWEECLRHFLDETLNPRPFKKRKITFEFLKSAERKKQNHDTPFLGDVATWQDLDLFCGKGDKNKFVANSLDRAQTDLGKVSLYRMLAQPITDITRLQKRQQIIKIFLEQDELSRELNACLSKLKSAENVMLSFWDRDMFKQGSKRHLFSFSLFEPLNDRELALLAKSSFDHTRRVWDTAVTSFAAIALFSYGFLHATNMIDMPGNLKQWADDYKGQGGSILVPFWGLQNRWLHAGIALLAGAWCASQAQESIKWARACIVYEECVQTMLMHVAQFTKGLEGLYAVVQNNKELAAFEAFAPLKQFFEKLVPETEKLQEFLALLKTGTFEGEASLFSNKGVVLKTYVLLHQVKSQLEGAMAAAGALDAYASLALLVKEPDTHYGSIQSLRDHPSTSSGGTSPRTGRASFCFPEYKTASKPEITLNGFWHPFIDPDSVVQNNIMFGGTDHRNNALVTGPNEGGKSTMLKTVTLCLLMAQTLGIAPAQSMTITPFTTISTYLNISDDIGAGNSLFKAEVLRTQALVDQITQARPDQFSFSVFDEIFNGTSPREGSVAAYSVAKHLGTFENSICLIATHFSLLTQLEQETDSFINYKVTVNRHDDGKITYPHKLERGISNQHVALDILRNQGFAGSIIHDAQAMLASERLLKN